MFQCDSPLAMQLFKNDYCSYLNSTDIYDPDLPLTYSKAHGGSMIMWKALHDPHVSIIPVGTSSFSPIKFSPPGHPTSIHIAVYLPTQGKEAEFLDEISSLILCIEQLSEQYPEALFYLRGDFNVSSTNKLRMCQIQHLCHQKELVSVSIPHKTYHHFVGGGKSDSDLDKIFFSKKAIPEEHYLQEGKSSCKFTS